MRKVLISILMVGGLALAGTAQASSYLQVGYVDYDDDDGVGGMLSSQIFGPLSFHVGHDTTDNLDRTRAGAAFSFDLIPLLQLEAGMNYERWDMGDVDEDGVSTYGELQYTFVPMFRLTGRVEYIDVEGVVGEPDEDGIPDGDDMVAGIGARIGPNTGPSAHVTFERFTDAEFNVVRANFRWGF